MYRITRSVLFVGLALLVPLSACRTRAPQPQATQLQIREFQTRTYATKDTKMVMKAVLNVLQDDGFIAKNADVDLGLITATKEIDVQDDTEAAWNTLLRGKEARWKKNTIIECSANISDFGDETRVRVNFQAKMMNNRGEVMTVENVTDAAYYQTFFSKVDKGIFIAKEKL